MDTYHGTTILSARRGSSVALGGDGQVTLGNIVVKATARKVRRLYHERILAGFPDHRPDDGQGSKGDAGGPATERPALCFRHRKGDRSRP